MSHQFSPAPNPDVQVPGAPIAQQGENVRAAFMNRVYMTLLLGIAAFVGMQYVLFITGVAATIAAIMTGNWLLLFGGFMLVSWMAARMSSTATTPGKAWAGYLVLIAANALLFAGPLWIANTVPELEGTITTAAWISILAFAGLSAIAMTTGKDFSFLGAIVRWAMVLAVVLIVGSLLFGAQLGTWFAVAMIGVAGAAILFDTQKVYKNFPPGTEVVAAMHLFSSLALLFWYVLQVLMRR